MSRLYYPKSSTAVGLAPGGGGGIDIGEAAKKVAKLIPVEIVTAYGALVGAALAIQKPGLQHPAFWVCFAACLILTPLYLNHVAEPGKPKRNQIIVGTLAFPVWAYLVSGQQVLGAAGWYDPSIGVIVAVLFSLVTALIPMD